MIYLSFNDNIYVICKKVYSFINNIFRSFGREDTNEYLKAYSSHIHPMGAEATGATRVAAPCPCYAGANGAEGAHWACTKVPLKE